MTENYIIEAEYFFNEGNAYLQEKDYDKALECHKKALEIAPELYKNDTIEAAFKHLGKIYLGKEEYNKAKEYQKKAIEVKHSLANVAAMAYNNRGIVFLNDKKYDKAITCFNKALKIKPDYEEAQKNLNEVYYTKEEIKKAKEEKKVFAIESKSQSLYSIGNEYFKNKKYNEAIKYYQKSIKVKPDYAAAYNSMGTAYKNEGKNDKALECYEKALEIKPDYKIAAEHIYMIKRLMKKTT
ncbi:MAG: tetratricopeptide repeat protein [Prevotellaceae bacterium]|jgi:tetratricopeptide (TPR) repeat protein|nr:tetratricopeptide repeat protein [Prevotellaceae bacterium]